MLDAAWRRLGGVARCSWESIRPGSRYLPGEIDDARAARGGQVGRLAAPPTWISLALDQHRHPRAHRPARSVDQPCVTIDRRRRPICRARRSPDENGEAGRNDGPKAQSDHANSSPSIAARDRLGASPRPARPHFIRRKSARRPPFDLVSRPPSSRNGLDPTAAFTRPLGDEAMIRSAAAALTVTIFLSGPAVANPATQDPTKVPAGTYAIARQAPREPDRQDRAHGLFALHRCTPQTAWTAASPTTQRTGRPPSSASRSIQSPSTPTTPPSTSRSPATSRRTNTPPSPSSRQRCRPLTARGR